MKKLDLENGYMEDPTCGICRYCGLLCVIGGGGGGMWFATQYSNYNSYAEET